MLSVLGHLSNIWCNFTLKVLHLAIRTLVVDHQVPITKLVVEQFPKDIRGVRSIFQLEAKTIIYAACPKCSCTYEPSMKNEVPIYPPRCTFRAFPSSSACNATLTTSRVHNRTSVRYPIRPFVTQCPESFIGDLLSRPGMEEILLSGAKHHQSGNVMFDITDGQRVQTLQGPDGKPFIEIPPDSSELRLMWTISIDWLNPFGNKASGKSVSIGAITLACLFLPPSLRYRPENLCLAGVIPGPKEPDYDQINHFTTPIVRKFHRMWSEGTWYTRTAKYPRGRLSRSAIAALVADLPGARKVSGQAHFKMRLFCALCLLTRDDINNLDRDSWVARCWKDILDAGYRYLRAPDQQTRNRLFQEHGVRWSAFMELPYWNNIISVVVEGMHNLFLGIIQHHFRTILSLDILDPNAREAPEINFAILGKVRALFSSGELTHKYLGKLNVPTLLAFHEELRLPLPDDFSSSRKGAKRFLVSSILVRFHNLSYSSRA